MLSPTPPSGPLLLSPRLPASIPRRLLSAANRRVLRLPRPLALAAAAAMAVLLCAAAFAAAGAAAAWLVTVPFWTNEAVDRIARVDDPSDMASYQVGTANVSDLPYGMIDYEGIRMNRPEIDLLLSYLRPSDVLLEYGSGVHTAAFARFVRRMHAIEFNQEKCAALQASLPADSRIYLTCVNLSKDVLGQLGGENAPRHGTYQQFKAYVDKVDHLEVPSFDRVFINGRARMACAIKVLPYLRPNSIVFIHDFFSRPDLYAAVFTYYDEVSRIMSFAAPVPKHVPQGLIALRMKASVTPDILPVPDEEIESLYNEYNSLSEAKKFSRAEQFRLIGSSLDSSFDLRSWKDMKKLGLAAVRLAIDLATLGVLVGTAAVGWWVFRALFAGVVPAWPAGPMFSRGRHAVD